MNSRDSSAYLRERGWMMVADAPSAWRDPLFPMSGATSTSDAVAKQRDREARVDAQRVKAKKR